MGNNLYDKIITTKEAKTKICPFIQPNYTRGHYGNPNEPFSINCICSACMAWIYTKTKDIVYEEKEGYEEVIVPQLFTTDIVEWHRDLPEDEKKGYCARLC